MRIHIIEVDDWTAVYKDGKSVWQNHSCPLVEGLQALGIEHTREWFEDGEFDEDMITRLDGTDLFPEELPNFEPEKIELSEAERELDALHAFGVDNWEGYDDAMRYLATGEQDVW